MSNVLTMVDTRRVPVRTAPPGTAPTAAVLAESLRYYNGIDPLPRRRARGWLLIGVLVLVTVALVVAGQV